MNRCFHSRPTLSALTVLFDSSTPSSSSFTNSSSPAGCMILFELFLVVFVVSVIDSTPPALLFDLFVFVFTKPSTPPAGSNNVVEFVECMFSLKKKIENAVVRAEILTTTTLELEEARRIKQEELLREHNMWDDVVKSNEILIKFADTTKVVNALKDLRYKAEEAKLITELAEMEAINYKLFKQAYNASMDVSKFVDQYEMSKLLSGPFDMEGACVHIRAESDGNNSEVWNISSRLKPRAFIIIEDSEEQLLVMYIKWADKQGYKGRVIEKSPCKDGGIQSATLEIEAKYVYGYLAGERGVHRAIENFNDESFTRQKLILLQNEGKFSMRDVIPLFLESSNEYQIDENDLLISSLKPHLEEQLTCRTEPVISILHYPTGVTVLSSGERNKFANKIKALNRLKAKLLVIAMEQGVSNVKNIKADSISDSQRQETRRYIFHPYKLVHDVKTGTHLPELNSILDGNIEPLIRAHLNNRLASDKA
ncbi:hypothetical protein Syun_017675 [Stephania yunnanensis]|uniref:Peptide chain release factor domain-containing protein n=1 Tax=Stephania yunnanensis TaxID=152371 RepID=A0AAP0J7G8_9MAGN